MPQTMNKNLYISMLCLFAFTQCQDQNQGHRSADLSSSPTGEGPYQATGIKIGEVNQNTAIIWTRLTKNSQRVSGKAPMPEISYQDPETGEWKPRSGRPDRLVRVIYPEGYHLFNIHGAVPGSPGEVQIVYAVTGTNEWSYTGWEPVDSDQDYIHQFKLHDLLPATNYELKAEARDAASKQVRSTISGHFRTAPVKDSVEKIVFTVTTGTSYGDRDNGEEGFKIYNQMLQLNPNFFVHTGDILYYDGQAKTPALARWHWDRMYSLPSNVVFHQQVPSYFMKDDHDTWMNDCWPGQETQFMGEFTFAQGLEIFRQEVPIDTPTYRTYRWGKDLQIWLMEGRDYRSPNTMPDGPEKTIWGKEQKEWFKRGILESNATFRLLISPTPIVGPDRENKRDNHSNKDFTYEGDEIRKFIATQKNMYIICGDRHWQYISKDLKTGVREYSCGPGSNEHAGGWSNEELLPEHSYLNVTGGFLSGTIERRDGTPTLTFRHHGVDGKVLNEDILELD